MRSSLALSRRSKFGIIIGAVAVLLIANLASITPTGATAIPNSCSMLALTHAAKIISENRREVVGKISPVNTHDVKINACNQKVGAILVHLTIGTRTGGYGRIKDVHISHPVGLGHHVTLVVAKNLGPHGGPYDLVFFSKGILWVSVRANGAAPFALTDLARQIYKSLTLTPASPPSSTTPSNPLLWNAIGPANFADYSQTILGNIGPSSGLSAAGKIGALAVDFANPQVMYVGGGGGDNRGPLSEAGIYKTIDGGKMWSPANQGLTSNQVNALWLDPSNANVLLAATEGGIFKSTDAGSQWSSVDQTASIGFATMGSTIYAGTADGVASSVNAGSSWASVETMSYPVTAITTAGDVLYVADEAFLWSWTATTGWQKVYPAPSIPTQVSSDWISWVVASPANPTTVFMIHCPQLPGQLFCTHMVSKSTDGGVTWSALSASNTYLPGLLDSQAIALDSVNPQTIYVAGEATVSVSENGGTSFTQTVVNPDIWFLLAWPNMAGTYFAGTDQGLYLLSDGGSTWKSLNGNLTTSLLYNVTVDGSTIFAAAQDYSPFSSFDSGATWSMQATSSSAKGEEGEDFIDPITPNTVFAMTGGWGLQVSFDGGQSFSPVSSVPASSYNQSPQGIAVASDGTIFVATAVGVYSSTDGGHSFRATGWPMPHPSMIELGASGTGTIFVGTRDTPGNAGAASTGALYFSADGGTTWQQSDLGGAAGYPTTVSVNPQDPNTVFLGMSVGPQSGGGIFISSNGGKSFVPANSGIPVIPQYEAGVAYPAIWQISYDPANSLVLAATSNGIFAQTTSTGSWRSITANAIPSMFTGIAWSSGDVYVSTMGEGILRVPVTNLVTWLDRG